MIKVIGSIFFIGLLIYADWLAFKIRGRAVPEKDDDPFINAAADAWTQHYLDIHKKEK